MSVGFKSTVVGSFPYENTPANMEKALLDQIQAGVDYPCYPQLVSMIDQFMDPLVASVPGLTKEVQVYRMEGELELPAEPYALEYGKFVVDYLADRPELREGISGLKACLTGPFTLAGALICSPEHTGGANPVIFEEPRAIMSEELLLKLARMVKGIAAAYSSMGFDLISIDEPTLGLIVGKRRNLFHQDDTVVKVLNTAFSGVQGTKSIHVCGRLSQRLVEVLLQTDANILDHEFTTGENEGVFDPARFQDEGKFLGYGVLESMVKHQTDARVENLVDSIDAVRTRVDRAIEQFGKENLVLKPDCGFGGLLATFGQELASEVVRRKLQTLTTVLNERR
jgi:5-methyltetrahydropteroyltriglutamate--homocysteine methyltransferase